MCFLSKRTMKEMARPETKPIRAWKVFSVFRQKRGVLRSTAMDNRYAHKGPYRADLAPYEHNSHGFHVFSKESHAKRKTNDNMPDYQYREVKIWGQMVKHPDGYRAQYMSIPGLPAKGKKKPAKKKVAKRRIR